MSTNYEKNEYSTDLKAWAMLRSQPLYHRHRQQILYSQRTSASVIRSQLSANVAIAARQDT
jgi:hypothetical protein